MYQCAACGADLFSSDTKFDSGTGWPSFTEPATAASVDLHEDRCHGMLRTEVTCKRCGSHLGHVFPDGPQRGRRHALLHQLALPPPVRSAEGEERLTRSQEQDTGGRFDRRAQPARRSTVGVLVAAAVTAVAPFGRRSGHDDACDRLPADRAGRRARRRPDAGFVAAASR